MQTREQLKEKVAADLFWEAAQSGKGLYALVYEHPATAYLSPRHRAILFGDTSADTVRISGIKGEIDVPIVNAEVTHIEVSHTQAMRITKHGTACVLHGTEGKVTLDNGVLAPPRRLHISPEHAKAYGFTDGQQIWVRIESEARSLTYGNVIVSIGETICPTLYLDQDETAAAGLTEGQSVRLLPTLEEGT